MSTQSLDLKLSDEEIAKHVTEVIDGSGPLPSAEEMVRGVADAATAKAVWWIVEWMSDRDSNIRFQPSIDTASDLKDILEGQGLHRPPGMPYSDVSPRRV